MSVALRILAPEPRELSLDDLAETIRTAFAASRRHGMAKAEADLTIGRALLDARIWFPSDRQFGQWFAAQRFGFSRQWSLELRNAAEREPEVRALLTSYLSQGREPSIARAVTELSETGPKSCTDRERFAPHAHVRHPYQSEGWLCLTDDGDPDERIAWADHLAASAAAHHEAFERRRLPGDGLPHGNAPSFEVSRDYRPLPPAPGSAAALRVDLAWHVAKRDALTAQLAMLPAWIASEEAAIARYQDALDLLSAEASA